MRSKQPKSSHWLQVDFGTSTTLVSIIESSGEGGREKPTIVPIGRDGANWMPSVVAWVDSGETVVVGEDALDQMAAADLLWPNVKLDLTLNPGVTRTENNVTQTGWDAAEAIVKEALDRALETPEVKPLALDPSTTELRLACSAAADSRYVEGLVKVAHALGWKRARVLDVAAEPVSAAEALRYSGEALREKLGDDDQVLIYDFGGGTFDAALVRLNLDGASAVGETLAFDAAPGVGGAEIDKIVMGILRQKVLDASDETEDLDFLTARDPGDPYLLRVQRTWRARAMKLKELIARGKVTISGMELDLQLLNRSLGSRFDDQVRVAITAEELASHSEMRKLLDRTAQAVDSVLRDGALRRVMERHAGLPETEQWREAELEYDRLRQRVKIMLVGGTTHMPSVRSFVERELLGGVPKSRWVSYTTEPEEAVVEGLARHRADAVDPRRDLRRWRLDLIGLNAEEKDCFRLELLPAYDIAPTTAHRELLQRVLTRLRNGEQSGRIDREARELLAELSPRSFEVHGAFGEQRAAWIQQYRSIDPKASDQTARTWVDGRLIQLWADLVTYGPYVRDLGSAQAAVVEDPKAPERTRHGVRWARGGRLKGELFCSPCVEGQADHGLRELWTASSGPCHVHHRGVRGPRDAFDLAYGLATLDIGHPLWVEDIALPPDVVRLQARWTCVSPGEEGSWRVPLAWSRRGDRLPKIASTDQFESSLVLDDVQSSIEIPRLVPVARPGTGTGGIGSGPITREAVVAHVAVPAQAVVARPRRAGRRG
ncbi:MAG: Hsp70 family protein, partial [Armatimonadetes bacterium]|nr:Hsp70 family protein [Armatimonadota bacterium]